MSELTEENLLKAIKETLEMPKLTTNIMYSADMLYAVLNLATNNERKRIFDRLEQEQARTKLGFIQYKRIEEIVNE